MKSRPDLKYRVLSIAVLCCVPLTVRCGSDSDVGGTSGASGEVERDAGDSGLGHAGHAGSDYAGSAGESTSGGTEAAGAAGDTSSGIGGLTDSIGGASAGTGGLSDSIGGASAGTGGASAGTGGESAGTGGGGVAGAGPGILNVSTNILPLMGACTAPSQTFIISNTGQSALTWTAALSLPYIVVAPSSSTLLPGTAITVSVSTTTPVHLGPTPEVVITITSDVAEQPPAKVSVYYAVSGTLIGVQPDLDVGEVPLGQSKWVSVPAPPHAIDLALGSSNPAFSVENALVHGDDHWTMRFTPSALGPQSTTLSIIAPFNGAPACPSPNRFIARGVGTAP